jgi:hypothetical protein
VAEHLHDDPRVDVLGHQQSGGRVPAVLQADLAHDGPVKNCLKACQSDCRPIGFPLA